MTVKLDSLQAITIEVELTPEHVKSLRKTAHDAALHQYGVSATDIDEIAGAAFDAVFKLLGEWAEQMQTGCCTVCEGAGSILTPDGVLACMDCLGTGHAHAPGSPCPNTIVAKDESWMQVHKRAVEMREEAQALLHVAQHEMRCPHKVEEEGFGNLTRRCALNRDHPGECNARGTDTE